MTISLYFVRHGQTYLNKYHRIQGVIDSSLTEKGINDALDAGQRLSTIHFDAAYSSDLPRAIETGRLILSQNPSDTKTTTPLAGFRELNFGYWEGEDDVKTWHIIGGPHGLNSFHEMIAEYGIDKAEDTIAAADPYKDAETSQAFWNRLQPAIDQTVKNAKDGDNILIATHGTLIRNVVSHFSDIPVNVSTKNGSVTKVNWDGTNYTVDYFNNVSKNV